MNQLSNIEKHTLKELETTIDKTRGAFVECGLALAQIRDKKLYRIGFPNFEEYCQEKWGWNRTRAYQLIGAAEVVDSLPKKLSTIVDNEAQARELGKVPEEDRAAVLKEVAAAGEVTAEAIKEHAEKPAPKSKEPKIEKDETGEPIPKELLEMWHRAEEMGADLCQKISFVKCAMDDGMQKDPIFAELNNGTIADLKNAHHAAKCIKPHAVCPCCSKDTRKKCKLCRSRGFISKFSWENHVRDESKAGRK